MSETFKQSKISVHSSFTNLLSAFSEALQKIMPGHTELFQELFQPQITERATIEFNRDARSLDQFDHSIQVDSTPTRQFDTPPSHQPYNLPSANQSNNLSLRQYGVYEEITPNLDETVETDAVSQGLTTENNSVTPWFISMDLDELPQEISTAMIKLTTTTYKLDLTSPSAVAFRTPVRSTIHRGIKATIRVPTRQTSHRTMNLTIRVPVRKTFRKAMSSMIRVPVRTTLRKPMNSKIRVPVKTMILEAINSTTRMLTRSTTHKVMTSIIHMRTRSTTRNAVRSGSKASIKLTSSPWFKLEQTDENTAIPLGYPMAVSVVSCNSIIRVP